MMTAQQSPSAPPPHHNPYYCCAQLTTMPPQQLHVHTTPQPMGAAQPAQLHQAAPPHHPQQQPAVYHSAMQPPLPASLLLTSAAMPTAFAQTVAQLPQTPAPPPGCAPPPFPALGAFSSFQPPRPDTGLRSAAPPPATIKVTMMPRSPSLEEPANDGGEGSEGGEGGDSNHPSRKRLKHNVAERRRTSRLNALFDQLGGVLSSRPDLSFVSPDYPLGKADILIGSIGYIKSLHQKIDTLQLKLSSSHALQPTMKVSSPLAPQPTMKASSPLAPQALPAAVPFHTPLSMQTTATVTATARTQQVIYVHP